MHILSVPLYVPVSERLGLRVHFYPYRQALYT